MGKKLQGAFSLGLSGLILYGCVVTAIKNDVAAPSPPVVTNRPDQTRRWKALPAEWLGTKSTSGLDFVDDAIDEILRVCPSLNSMIDHSDGITYAWAIEDYSGNYIARTWGWDIQLEIGVILGGSYPMPSELEGRGVRLDHVLFIVGSGWAPGLEVDKQTSQYACGMPVGPSRDILIPDPWMAQMEQRLPADLRQARPAKPSMADLRTLRRYSGDPVHPRVWDIKAHAP